MGRELSVISELSSWARSVVAQSSVAATARRGAETRFMGTVLPGLIVSFNPNITRGMS